jgi:hypothetical protein
MSRRILPGDPALKALAERALSRRRVKESVRIGQRWVDEDGAKWTVRQIHRKDGMVRLEGPGSQPRFVGFGALGSLYRAIER